MPTDNITTVAQIDHEQWLRHQGTRLFFKWLDSEIDKQASLIADLSGEYELKTNDKLQRFAMRLKTLKTIRKAAADSTTIATL